MRARVVILIALLLAGALAYVLLQRGGDEGDRRQIARAPATEGERAPTRLQGRAAVEAPRGTSPSMPTEAGTTRTDGAPSRVWLRGAVRGLDVVGDGVAVVRVLPVRNGWVDTSAPSLEGTVSSDDTFGLDVTDLIADAEGLSHLEVRVDHPETVQGRARAAVAGVRARGAGELTVVVVLHPGLAVTGRVLTERGEPVVGGHVALFSHSRSFGALRATSEAETRTDAEGRYRLRIAATGPYRVVAVAPERLPAGADVVVPPGGGVEVASLVLQPGVAVVGRVRFRGAFVPGIWVRVAPAGQENAIPMEVGQRSVVWAEGEPPRSEHWVQADDEGAFRVTGVTPGRHVLSLSRTGAPSLPHLIPTVLETVARAFHAPAEDVVLDVTGAVVQVCVVDASGPVEGAAVEVADGAASLSVRSDAEGVARFLLPPLTASTVHVRKEGFLEQDMAITTAAAGSTQDFEVTLLPAAPVPELYVTFTGAYVGALEQATFELEDLSNPGRMPIQRQVREAAGTATYRVPEVSPGRYRLTVRPGAAMWGAFGFFLPDVREVVLPPEGSVHVEVALRSGGRLRIAARNADGVLLAARCEIRDAGGEVIEASYTVQTDTMATTSQGRLGTLSPSLADPPLPAGSYTVELTLDGFEPRIVRADVKEDETTQVDVTLHAR